MENLTPMQKQYMEIKKEHADAILLFRLGDFYEAFNEDAKTISEVLGIALTGRGKGDGRIPMAGIPYHALDNYLYKLVQAGYKIAIAEQLTEPEAGKIVERKVTKIVTSGTFTDPKNLKDDQNNYIACIYITSKIEYLAYLDITTGEFFIQEFSNLKALLNEINRLRPSEIVISEKFKNLEIGFKDLRKEYIYESDFDLSRAYEHLTRHFKTQTLKGFGLSEKDLCIIPAGVLLSYVKDNQKTNLEHISSIRKLENVKFMKLDPASISNLELVNSIRTDGANNSLLKTLNNCSTSLGMRLLRKWLLLPLIDKTEIERRLDSVGQLFNSESAYTIAEMLCNVLDIERIIARIGTGNITGRDLIALKNSLLAINDIYKELTKLDFKSDLLKLTKSLNYDNYSFVVELIEKSIEEECPVFFDKGGVIKTGYNEEIDQLRKLKTEGSSFIETMQNREREKSGINSLKIKFNNVFGYYIEISKAYADKIPLEYVRKQTLVNAERYITPELKTFEEKILTAQEKLVTLEIKQFELIITELRKHIVLIQELAKYVAMLDVFTNFALTAKERGYIKPNITDQSEIVIENGRHPVVELIKKENFIPNDLKLEDGNIIILTGPNMSGKSTYIRQIALIVLMAQIGSFVPAAKANLEVVDRIFTRVWASDNLSAGESTFMVEMNETANILNNATKDSLIILDEVGRGTSTYDGVAIAWSIVEFLNNKIKAATLFATHYHELVKLEDKYSSIKNYHVDVIDESENIVFTHKIKSGGMNKSYGVHVAEMAGVPKEVVTRANDILKSLELKTKQTQKKIEKSDEKINKKIANPEILQISLFD